jgi:F-type H+-transporting ATPase subunit epsilon
VATTSFELVTPTSNLFTGAAEMIVCKTVEGEIAFLADHEAYIGALDPCVVRIVNGQAGAQGGAGETISAAEIRIAVHGGFVEVKDNRVIMLADIALRPEEVDLQRSQADEAEATGRVTSAPGGEPDKAAERDLKWAQAQLEAARGGSQVP